MEKQDNAMYEGRQKQRGEEFRRVEPFFLPAGAGPAKMGYCTRSFVL